MCHLVLCVACSGVDLRAELNLKPVLLLDLKEKYNLGNMEPRMELIIN